MELGGQWYLPCLQQGVMQGQGFLGMTGGGVVPTVIQGHNRPKDHELVTSNQTVQTVTPGLVPIQRRVAVNERTPPYLLPMGLFPSFSGQQLENVNSVYQSQQHFSPDKTGLYQQQPNSPQPLAGLQPVETSKGYLYNPYQPLQAASNPPYHQQLPLTSLNIGQLSHLNQVINPLSSIGRTSLLKTPLLATQVHILLIYHTYLVQ